MGENIFSQTIYNYKAATCKFSTTFASMKQTVYVITFLMWTIQNNVKIYKQRKKAFSNNKHYR